jgi:ATP-dependent Clp protease ATP-binding subunit ClpA
MGARPLARVIEENVKRPLAEEILFGKLAKGGNVRVIVEKGEDDAETIGFDIEPAPERKPRKKKGKGGSRKKAEPVE